MQLITKQLLKRLREVGEQNENPLVIIKYFNPSGAGTWYVTGVADIEINIVGGGFISQRLQDMTDDEFKSLDIARVSDIRFFGFVDLGNSDDAEMGYFTLSELQEYQHPLFKTRIERDLYCAEDNLYNFILKK